MKFISDIGEMKTFMTHVINCGFGGLKRLGKSRYFPDTLFWNATGHEAPDFPTVYFSIDLFERWQKE